MKGIQLSGGAPGFFGSIFSMITGIVSVANVAEAVCISLLCTVLSFFLNRWLKRKFK
jgi:hypothetical protein